MEPTVAAAMGAPASRAHPDVGVVAQRGAAGTVEEQRRLLPRRQHLRPGEEHLGGAAGRQLLHAAPRGGRPGPGGCCRALAAGGGGAGIGGRLLHWQPEVGACSNRGGWSKCWAACAQKSSRRRGSDRPPPAPAAAHLRCCPTGRCRRSAQTAPPRRLAAPQSWRSASALPALPPLPPPRRRQARPPAAALAAAAAPACPEPSC